MKANLHLHFGAAILLFTILGLPPSSAFAQGTAFSYQGQLYSGTNPASGTYNFEFSLFNVPSGGSQLGALVITNNVSVTNGMFMVLIDFGAGIFTGATNWLQIAVETNTGGTFTNLAPRQQLTPTPYAIFAENAADATVLLNGTALGAGSGNSITSSQDAFIGGGAGNQILASSQFTAIGAGLDNTVEANAGFSFIGGGQGNQTSSGWSVIGGGNGNLVGSGTQGSTIGGGYNNTNTASFATVPGGYKNVASGEYGFAAGQQAQALHPGAFVWADSQNATFSSTANNQFLVRAQGGVGIGTNNPQQSLSVAGGLNIDQASQNNGSAANALTFGSGSGEGIGSQRTSGTGQYDLVFYTQSDPRMTILNGGHVGINTTNPATQLEVNGEFAMVDGLAGTQCYIGGDSYPADVKIGSLNSNITQVTCWNEGSQAYMHLNCSSVTIEGGSDLAEPFKITSSDGEVPQGAVVVIDDQNPGHLKMSGQAYDTRVAGVVSGANGIHPGIQMQQQGVLDGGKNVALTGRVYALADASNGAIHPGDLLTTSSVPGHAMKVADHAKAQGAILGKAMTGLSDGRGMVLVLVTLQ